MYSPWSKSSRSAPVWWKPYIIPAVVYSRTQSKTYKIEHVRRISKLYTKCGGWTPILNIKSYKKDNIINQEVVDVHFLF